MAKHSNVFYVRESDGTYTPRKDAVSVKNEFGGDIFKSKGLYYEGQTGVFICNKDRIGGFLSNTADKTAQFAPNVQAAIDKFGLSLRYTQPEVMKNDIFPRDESCILSHALYHKQKCRFTRVYDENGIQFYTMDKEKSAYPMLYTQCEGWMVGLCRRDELQKGIEYLSQPGFDLYASIVEQYEKSLENPSRWADVSVAEFLGRRAEADEHNIPVMEARERKEREDDENRAAEYRAYEERAALEYKTTIETAERKLIGGQRITNGEIDGKNLFLQLFRENGVNVPLKTQGWVKSTLTAIQIKSSEDITYWRNGRPSTVIIDYIQELMEKVAAKYENAQIREDCEQDASGGVGDGEEMEY